jgi:hypothetical protein
MLIVLENEGRYGTMISGPSLMAAGNDVRGGPAVAEKRDAEKEIAKRFKGEMGGQSRSIIQFVLLAPHVQTFARPTFAKPSNKQPSNQNGARVGV